LGSCFHSSAIFYQQRYAFDEEISHRQTFGKAGKAQTFSTGNKITEKGA